MKVTALITIASALEIDTEHWPVHAQAHWDDIDWAISEMVMTLINRKGGRPIETRISTPEDSHPHMPDGEVVNGWVSQWWPEHNYLANIVHNLFKLLEDMKVSSFNEEELKELNRLLDMHNKYLDGGVC